MKNIMFIIKGNIKDDVICHEEDPDNPKRIKITFRNGKTYSYNRDNVQIIRNALISMPVNSLFDYYKKASEYNSLHADGEKILKNIYDKIDFVSSDSVLAWYLNGKSTERYAMDRNAVFPFGCNLSQIAAVQNALTHNISIIEGPPGTGKTQTILNIIANIVMNDKTVMIVSNNNHATDNVFEKLEKYDYSYIAAQLGSRSNKEKFIDEKQTPYPDFSDYPNMPDDFSLTTDIGEATENIKVLFEKKNRLAEIQMELSDLLLEQKYYLDYYNYYRDCCKSKFDGRIFKKNKFTSDTIDNLWNDLEQIAEQGIKPRFIRRLIYKFRYGLVSMSILSSDTGILLATIKKLYYEHKISELKKEIADLSAFLEAHRLDSLEEKLTSNSETMFRNYLRQKYDNGSKRKVFDNNIDAIDFLKEYPVLLSTAFSSRSCFKNQLYDYVIVDEASQVDLTCGILAMSCAKNIVIVGDLKQLPNVITQEDKKILSTLSDCNNIPNKYRCEKHSLLSSACEVFVDAPRTLLREHYRCHPKIISFCNKKFYNGQLVIMTSDNGERDVLKTHITAPGNHARGHFNQRQIDEIKEVVLPELHSEDLGIISPYNAQTSKLIQELGEQIPIHTVHKFQGRENDDIVISTVDNEITEFTDNPNMLNVAISRAKKRLRVVVSDNKSNKNTNIWELVRYMHHNNFEVQKSSIFSVFDMLYKEHEQKRLKYLRKHKRISEYDSENLMHALIKDVLKRNEFSMLDVVSHIPLNNIIRDVNLLDDDEKRYVMNPMTHIDFMIFDSINKEPTLAVEVDGYAFHKKESRQYNRDKLKNAILDKCGMPLIRFSTTGSREEEKLTETLRHVLGMK